MERQCSVSVDLDTLRYYLQIHGLEGGKKGTDAVYGHALPRILNLFSRYGVRGTFFVIGEDLEEERHREILSEAVEQGHELANHTYHHAYGLVHLEREELEEEIGQAEEAIEKLLPAGKRVSGFRAPGYNVNKKILEVLRQRGYQYDSSVFPCPPYYLAKGMVMGWLAFKRRPSRSVLGDPRVLLAPTTPYQPGEDPHQAQEKKREGLWEIPVAVLPGLRLPYIGTWLLLFPRNILPLCNTLMIRQHQLINLELHGIDLIDPARDPIPSALQGRQPDLRFSLAEKEERFGLTLAQIAKSHRFLPLGEAVASLGEE